MPQTQRTGARDDAGGEEEEGEEPYHSAPEGGSAFDSGSQRAGDDAESVSGDSEDRDSEAAADSSDGEDVAWDPGMATPARGGPRGGAARLLPRHTAARSRRRALKAAQRSGGSGGGGMEQKRRPAAPETAGAACADGAELDRGAEEARVRAARPCLGLTAGTHRFSIGAFVHDRVHDVMCIPMGH